MTTDTFAEFLNKLKEIHEKEVQGLGRSLVTLFSWVFSHISDAQRIEELFAKNHQLREQQKVLKENVKVLENRLRAGLCDRCMVTQELAKKKQNEYETSHFQSLQHIFILTNEMSRLKEENKTLKEELKRLQNVICTEHPGEVSAHAGIGLGSTQSPALHGQTAHPEFSPQASQRISNQLHGTIALVRPGSRPCLLEKSPSGAAVSPPARKTPLPLERERSPNSPKLASSYETLKLTTRKEQLCLLNRHFSLHQLGLAGNCALADRDGSFPSHLLRAKDGEGRMRPPDDWDDRAALLKLPAAVVYMRDQHLEGKLHLLKHRERLQHLLLHQRQQSQRARAESDPKSVPEERPLSPWPSIVGGCKEERSFLEDAVDGKEEKELWLSRDGSEHREKVEVGRDYGADVPLDLSDAGRGREAGWRDCREPREAGSPRPSPRGSPMHGPCGRHGMERDGSRPPSPCQPQAGQNPSFHVSTDDDDAESGQQESDEADTTDSEVGLLSQPLGFGCLGLAAPSDWGFLFGEALGGAGRVVPARLPAGGGGSSSTRCQAPLPQLPNWLLRGGDVALSR
uniref:RBBP8 N-terminal like n=1 Tax=Anser brachyrhynchus TaxID=132585 RepID=A0A8B9BL57_9AVES